MENRWQQRFENFSKALQKFWKLKPDERKIMAENARKALDRFRPEVIKKEWKCLLNQCDESLPNEYDNSIFKIKVFFCCF